MPRYHLRGVDVDFPHEAYPCQQQYMSRVIESLQTGKNALLESPTGTGKTLCLLCAAVAWQQSCEVPEMPAASAPHSGSFAAAQTGLEEAAAPAKPKIIYASRTHSQLHQVINELKLAVSKGTSNPAICVLGSRDQMCVHPEVKTFVGGRQNAACRALVAANNCRYREGVDEFLRRHNRKEMLDIEDLGKRGQDASFCPFFASRELQQTADIIFLPYNYLIDHSARKTLEANMDLSSCVVIFDEAHNLEGLCSDASSMDLRATDLANALRDVGIASRMVGYGEEDVQCSAEELGTLTGLLENISKELDAVPLSQGNELTKEGGWALEFFERASEGQLNFNTKEMFLDMLDRVGMTLASAAQDSNFSQETSLQKIANAVNLIFHASSKEYALQHSKFYMVHIHIDPEMERPGRTFDSFVPKNRPSSSGRIFSYWCFNPGIAMKSLRDYGIKSVILTSGTLSPLPSFAAELQTKFDVTLENPHVIQPSQIFAGVLRKGPTGKDLNSSYQTRDDPLYKSDLGNAMVSLSRLFTGGLLVFFPSYAVMEKCTEYWKMSPASGQGNSILQRLGQNKHIVVEPRQSSKLQEAMEEYYEHVRRSERTGTGGAAFFAVCRGKVSEGLDFANANGRAVIVTGIPYAAAMDPKVKLKKEYQNRAYATRHQSPQPIECINGDEWYKQQALRAVNQAIGRVIRHKDDFGAILLCDQRFSGQVSQLSKWMRPHVKVYDKFGEVVSNLVKFFRANITVQQARSQPVELHIVQQVAPQFVPQAAPTAPAALPPSLLHVLGSTSRPAPSTWGVQPVRQPTASLSSRLAHPQSSGAVAAAKSVSAPASKPDGDMVPRTHIPLPTPSGGNADRGQCHRNFAAYAKQTLSQVQMRQLRLVMGELKAGSTSDTGAIFQQFFDIFVEVTGHCVKLVRLVEPCVPQKHRDSFIAAAQARGLWTDGARVALHPSYSAADSSVSPNTRRENAEKQCRADPSVCCSASRKQAAVGYSAASAVVTSAGAAPETLRAAPLPPGDRKKNSKSFLGEVKEALSEKEFDKFKQALQMMRDNKNLQDQKTFSAAYEKVLQVFNSISADGTRNDIVETFAPFVRAGDQQIFAELAERHRLRRAAQQRTYSEPLQPMPKKRKGRDVFDMLSGGHARVRVQGRSVSRARASDGVPQTVGPNRGPGHTPQSAQTGAGDQTGAGATADAASGPKGTVLCPAEPARSCTALCPICGELRLELMSANCAHEACQFCWCG
jgi:regulator of telomere elongation helicase 1